MNAALDQHVALIGFMGAGKTTLGEHSAARIGRPFVDLDQELERETGEPIATLFRQSETDFRIREAKKTIEALEQRKPAVLALGGGAVTSESVRKALREHAFTILLDADVEEAWERSRGGDRPLAQDELHFRALYTKRQPVYAESADARATDVDGIVLAAAAVHVEPGSFARLGELTGRQPLALVADANLARLYGAAARAALGERLRTRHQLPPGEQAKTLEVVEQLWRDLRLDRGGAVVAVGGGCTLDASGFTAATYLRGVEWYSVPTSLVAQADAGIGGKTAIDLPEGKNLVGAFHWPRNTIVDAELLQTLPATERREGLAEVVKTGLLAGEPLWELEDAELVRRCAAYKAAVCLRDPLDRGERAVLNLGHTFAHALEAGASFEGVTHGQAVGLGLLAALRLSGVDTAPVEEVLSPKPVRVDRERAWEALQRDKKAANGRVRLVLLEAPGRPVYGVERPDDEVRAALDALIAG
jgi:3-dehydroquinate synthetase/shikimate kinase